MKYCVQYKPGYKYLDRIDEIIIHFRRQDTTLIDFLLLHKDKRVIIDIDNEDEFIEYDCIKIFTSALEQHPEINFVFRLGDPRVEGAQNLAEKIREEKSLSKRFFFDNFVDNWDTLMGLLEYYPSDMYITGSLGFEIKDVAELLHALDVKVRVFPNVAQSTWAIDSLRKFFIRPEDIQFYEPYVDVCEFFKSEKSLATLYKIYAIDKHWSGKLQELILSFTDNEIDSRCILPQFAESRLNCRKKCMKGKGCHICDAIGQLAEMLNKNDIILKDMVK